MKGIELTRNGSGHTPVWVPLNSITLIWPYVGFDSKIDGTEIALNNNGAVRVTEGYVAVIEELQKL